MEKETTRNSVRPDMKKKENMKSSEMEIVIKRHQQLFDLLNDPHRMWRVLLSLFLIYYCPLNLDFLAHVCA